MSTPTQPTTFGRDYQGTLESLPVAAHIREWVARQRQKK